MGGGRRIFDSISGEDGISYPGDSQFDVLMTANNSGIDISTINGHQIPSPPSKFTKLLLRAAPQPISTKNVHDEQDYDSDGPASSPAESSVKGEVNGYSTTATSSQSSLNSEDASLAYSFSPLAPSFSSLVPSFSPLTLANSREASPVRSSQITPMNLSSSPLDTSLTTATTAQVNQFLRSSHSQPVSLIQSHEPIEDLKDYEKLLLDRVKKENEANFLKSASEVIPAIEEFVEHIPEENLEIIALMAEAKDKQIGIFYQAGLNKTAIATGRAVYGMSADYKPENLALLTDTKFIPSFVQVDGEKKQVDTQYTVFLSDASPKARKKPFYPVGSKIYIMVCYASTHKFITDESLEKTVTAFINVGVSEVVLYLGRDAGSQQNIEKRDQWLNNNSSIIDKLRGLALKENDITKISVLNRADFVKNPLYTNAELFFLDRLSADSEIQKATVEDICKRLQQKLLLSARHSSPHKAQRESTGGKFMATTPKSGRRLFDSPTPPHADPVLDAITDRIGTEKFSISTVQQLAMFSAIYANTRQLLSQNPTALLDDNTILSVINSTALNLENTNYGNSSMMEEETKDNVSEGNDHSNSIRMG